MLKSLGWMSTEYLEGFCVIYGIFGVTVGHLYYLGFQDPVPGGSAALSMTLCGESAP